MQENNQFLEVTAEPHTYSLGKINKKSNYFIWIVRNHHILDELEVIDNLSGNADEIINDFLKKLYKIQQQSHHNDLGYVIKARIT